jgi:hypothetical protein
MMNIVPVLAAAILWQLFPTAGRVAPAGKTNDYVTYSASVDRKQVAAGSSASLLFRLVPKKGIHINLDPPLSLTFDSLPPALKLDQIKIPKRKEYLDAAQPIVQPLRIAAAARPATLKLKGTLTYYYCSDAEGWCSRYRQPVELALTIVK